MPQSLDIYRHLPDLKEQPVRIAVGWDTSGTDALELAGWLSKSMPSLVRVISTETPPWSASISKKGKKYAKWRKETHAARAAEVRKALKELVPKDKWDEEYYVLADARVREDSFNEEASRFGANILVLGSKEKADKGRFVPNRATGSLMRSSRVPLGLVPRAAKLSKRGLSRITYAFLDDCGPQRPNQGLEIAATLALRLDVPLRIVAFSPVGAEQKMHTLTDEWNESSLATLDRARDCVTAIAQNLGLEAQRNFAVEAKVQAGDGWDRALSSIKWKKGDVLCLGSRPTPGERTVFVDEQTNEFLSHVSVPVVVFPQEGK